MHYASGGNFRLKIYLCVSDMNGISYNGKAFFVKAFKLSPQSLDFIVAEAYVIETVVAWNVIFWVNAVVFKP